MSDDFVTSAQLDAIRRRSKQESDPAEQLTPAERQKREQEAEDRRRGADFRNNSPEVKEQRARLVQTRQAFRSNLGGLSHGQSYDAKARTQIADSIINDLGGDVSADVKREVTRVVNSACDAIRHGDLQAGMTLADEVSDGIAATGTVGDAVVTEEESPAALAARIRR